MKKIPTNTIADAKPIRKAPHISTSGLLMPSSMISQSGRQIYRKATMMRNISTNISDRKSIHSIARFRWTELTYVCL